MIKKDKAKNLLDIIKAKVNRGHFLILPHALVRQGQRSISVPDIIQVLMTGWHEVKKDQYTEEFKEWNYAIRGKTIDDRDLRIIASFDEKNILIITVIDLKRNKL
jgi:hypothetical protein